MVLRMGTRRYAGPVGVSGLGRGQRTLGMGAGGIQDVAIIQSSWGPRLRAGWDVRLKRVVRLECGGRRVPEPSYL